MARKNSMPFGGIQISKPKKRSTIVPLTDSCPVMTGDFFQLPPVPDTETGNKKIPIQFLFQSHGFKSCIGNNIHLLHK